MLISYLLALFLVAASALAFRRLPPFHPVQLWCFVWSAMAVLYCLRLLPYKPLGLGAALVVGGATVAFAVGALIGQRTVAAAGSGDARAEPVSAAALQTAAIVAVALTALGAFAFLLDAARTYGLQAALLSSGDARRAVLEGANSVTDSYLYVAFAAVVLCALAAARSAGCDRRRFLILSGASAASMYLSTQRGMLFLAAVAGFLAFSQAAPTVDWKRLWTLFAALSLATLAMLVAVAGLQGRDLEHSAIADVPSVFRDDPALSDLGPTYEYLTAPLPALDEQVAVSSAFGAADGCATFRVVCSALGSLGFDVRAETVNRPYTSEPLRWNTYTSLDMPLIDGGRAFFWIVVVAMGLVAGALWAAARRGLLVGQVGYPLIGAATMFATWQNVFFEQLFIGAGILAFLLAWGFNRLGARSRAVSA